MNTTSNWKFAVVCAIGLLPNWQTHAATYVKFDAPGAGTQSAQGTTPESINSSSAISGEYIDSGGVEHGFVRATDGTITSFDPTGSVQTFASDLNDSGTLTGDWADSNSFYYGYLRTADGSITTFEGSSGSPFTDSSSINNLGLVAGHYNNGSTDRGFVRKADGRIISFDAPGAGFTLGGHINDKNVVG